MRRIRELDNNDTGGNKIEQTETLPLPCNYFDFIVGTSTGGYVNNALRNPSDFAF